MTARTLALACFLGLLCCARVAEARIVRYAVVVGNNAGAAGDAPLRYAESDASRVEEVLRDLGGFAPANIVLLRGDNAETVRSTLIEVNERVRAAVATPGDQALLFVYYSGHADAQSLHLGSTELAVSQLSQLVRGSAATFRMLVLDACNSGAITRLKGGRSAPPFELPLERALTGEGLALITASSAHEAAQESDELRGSFFTHALLSGLLGAADVDRDGAVVLEEVYRYAYDTTLRATSRSWAGTQHPAFRYDVRGQGDLVITAPEAYAHRRSALEFAGGLSFLVFRDDASGAVVGEVHARDAMRTLSLRPGAYFVRGRARDYLFEGRFVVSSGERVTVRPDDMERVEYARLVRKGTGNAQKSQALHVAARTRSRLPNADTFCHGAGLGYGLDLAQVSLGLHGGLCTSTFTSSTLSARSNEYDASLRLSRAWDLRRLSLGLGVGGGASWLVQEFETPGAAPTRKSLVPVIMVVGTAAFELRRGFYVGMDVEAQTYLMRVRRSDTRTVERTAAFALRPALLMGKRF